MFGLCTCSIVYMKTNPQDINRAEKNIDVNKAQEGLTNVGENEVIVEENSKTNLNTDIDTDDNLSGSDKKTFKFTALGEIMMGGVDTSYLLSFKDVIEVARDSDYTFTSLTTNIVDLEKIENPTSKYIVTKDILKVFNALGIDGVNVASDHMLDFGINIFKGTKKILSDAKLDIMGIQDDIIYAEHNGIKIAFIALSNQVIGSYSEFVNAGIWVYDDYMLKIKAAIKKARDTADTVVVITHLGSEIRHVKTDIMIWFYRKLIDVGADLVLGNHSLGVYPIEIYNGAPIIYSLGYFMHDTDYEVGKKSGIYSFTVNTDGKIESLEFMPTYITDDGVRIYADLDYKGAIEFMKYVSNESDAENNLYETKMNQKSIVITFNK